MALQLYYFSARGRGEQIRILLHAAGQALEEVKVSKDNFAKLKSEPSVLPFGAVPVIHEGDFALAQGPAIMSYLGNKYGLAPAGGQQSRSRADALCMAAEDLRIKYFGLFGDGAEDKQAEFCASLWSQRWLPTLAALLEQNGNTGFFVGADLSYADIAMWDALDAIVRYIKGANFDAAPSMRSFYDGILDRPTIKSYVDSRSD